MRYIPLKDALMRFVDKNGPGGCWLWTGNIGLGGYGVMHLPRHKTTIRTHRASWIVAHGEIPAGKCVLHKCDNRRCVNPDHLFLGTYQDNRRDAMAKGRACLPRGSRHGRAKLNERQVVEIRKRIALGEQQTLIAKDYGVTPTAIGYIHKNRTWVHVNEGDAL